MRERVSSANRILFYTKIAFPRCPTLERGNGGNMSMENQNFDSRMRAIYFNNTMLVE